MKELKGKHVSYFRTCAVTGLNKQVTFERWIQYRLLFSCPNDQFWFGLVFSFGHPRFGISRYPHPVASYPLSTLLTQSDFECLKPGSLLSSEPSEASFPWVCLFLSSLTTWLSGTAHRNHIIRRWKKIYCCFISVLNIKKLNFKIVVI